MKLEIEINEDMLDQLILNHLSESYRDLESMREAREKGEAVPYLYQDQEEDLAELSRKLVAYRLVMEDFVVPGDPLPIDED
ncbi:MAG: hypothetical protein ACRC16_21980 [Aeromonas salmonicida]